MEKEFGQTLIEGGVLLVVSVVLLAVVYLLAKGLAYLTNKDEDSAEAVSTIGTMAEVLKSTKEETQANREQNKQITDTQREISTTQREISTQLGTSATIQQTMLGMIGTLQTDVGLMKLSLGQVEQDISTMKDNTDGFPEIVGTLSKQMDSVLETLNLMHTAHGEHDVSATKHKTDIVKAIETLQSMFGDFLEAFAVAPNAEETATNSTEKETLNDNPNAPDN